MTTRKHDATVLRLRLRFWRDQAQAAREERAVIRAYERRFSQLAKRTRREIARLHHLVAAATTHAR